MRWLASLVALSLGVLAASPALAVTFLNEIRVDQPGNDNDEYVELIGTPGESVTGLTLIVIGGSATNPAGVIEEVVNFSGTIQSSGYFVAAESTFTLGTANQTSALDFQNDSITFILVSGFTGADGQDLDGNNDGILDVAPWTTELDRIALIGESLNVTYGPPNVGPDGTSGSAFHIIRCNNGFVLSAQATGPEDTPGADNTCPSCGDGVVYTGEICDGDGMGVPGETATCDVDCTAATCGDGTLNTTATEQCDDGGESATCDLDCTNATCGDATINVTAGEACDDAGESATCDVDCTAATCGDGHTNMTALEDCDDSGESANCDIDCTSVSCGDMTVNNTAGETCDEGMRTAMCDGNCTAVSCGDGTLNVTAGEQCDDGGESSSCDADCTNAMCGDNIVNMTASEDCDTGSESATCDDDCTGPLCGDTNLNEAAGEECDDGNTTSGDGCDANCLDEGVGGMGGMGGTGGSGNMGGAPAGPGPSSSASSSSGGLIDNGADANPTSDGSCGCRTPGSSNESGKALLALMCLAVFALRRRR
jgi:MYXO-CTERM domain-containing protein